MQREAASVRQCALIFGINPRHLYAACRSQELCSHAVGRASVLFIADVRAWLRAKPQTKSPTRINDGGSHVVAA